jgi:5-methylcytosine-specific restriction protein A
MGGSRGAVTNSAANLVLLCRGCHAWVESHRADAYEQGWLVHRWQDPGPVPVYVAWQGWARLTLDGTYLAEGLRSDWESVEPASG